MAYNTTRHSRDVAQLGSAPHLGCGGRRFESCHPDLYLSLANSTKQSKLTPEIKKGRYLNQNQPTFSLELFAIYASQVRWIDQTKALQRGNFDIFGSYKPKNIFIRPTQSSVMAELSCSKTQSQVILLTRLQNLACPSAQRSGNIC